MFLIEFKLPHINFYNNSHKQPVQQPVYVNKTHYLKYDKMDIYLQLTLNINKKQQKTERRLLISSILSFSTKHMY